MRFHHYHIGIDELFYRITFHFERNVTKLAISSRQVRKFPKIDHYFVVSVNLFAVVSVLLHLLMTASNLKNRTISIRTSS